MLSRALTGRSPRRSAAAAAACAMHTHLGITAAEPRAHALHPAVVTRVTALTPDVRGVRLAAHPSFTFDAGQWVDVHIPGVEVVGGFTIVSAPRLTGPLAAALDAAVLPEVDLAVKRSAHPPAAWVHSDACAPGAAVLLRSGGRFTLRSAGLLAGRSGGDGADALTAAVDHVVLVAGGLGINPLYAMLLQLLAETNRRGGCGGRAPLRVTLLYSYRSAALAPFLPQLRTMLQLASADKNAGLQLALRCFETRACDDLPAPQQRAFSDAATGTLYDTLMRRMTAADIKGAICGDGADSEPGSRATVLVCGPGTFVTAARQWSVAAGVPASRVHHESWG